MQWKSGAVYASNDARVWLRKAYFFPKEIAAATNVLQRLSVGTASGDAFRGSNYLR